MVFCAASPSERLLQEEFMADGHEQRLHPRLHNFSLPPLKWQNQKTLRAIKFDPFHYLWDPDKGLSPNDPGCLNRPSPHPAPALDANALSSPYPHSSLVSRFLIKKLQKLPPLLINAGDRFETIRAKLLHHLRTVSRVRLAEEMESSPENRIPWFSGMERTSACEVPASMEGGDEMPKARADGCPPLVPEGRPKSLRLRGLAPEQSNLRLDIPRFLTSLSRRQIEEDFLAMTGSKPSRRPKKRAKCIQKILDDNFPGLLLSNITLDSYKVSGSH